MKLTESKLKQLIVETLNENKDQAKKIFSMIRPRHGQPKEEDYNQAVMLTAFGGLLNDILPLWDEYFDYLYKWGIDMYCTSPAGYVQNYSECAEKVFRDAEEQKQKFIDDVVREISAKQMSDYKSSIK